MANISFAILRHDLRLYIQTQTFGEQTTDCANRSRDASADIDRLIISAIGFEGAQICLHDVADVNEIACLFTVFKDHRPIAVEQTRRKDRAHAGVRIR